MEIVSACELRPGGVLWLTARGALTLTVVAKATYALRPIESPLAERQDDPSESDDYWNDDEHRSLRAASDYAPFKARADVILVGRAFAPGGRPARSLMARMLVAGVDKCVEVFCDRSFRLDGSLHEGPPFVAMPLHWERAAGGPGTQNPVGLSPDGPRDTYGTLALPNLQPPGIHVQSPGDFIRPIGFGPIAPTWPSRWGRLHARLSGWDFRAWNRAPLPPDLDPAFFNAAPSDQQVDVIRPDEQIVLENLDPDHPRLFTRLAKATPRLVIERGASTEELGMRCDSLLIDTDRRRCTLTWRAQLPLDAPDQRGRVVITTQPATLRRREDGALSTTQAPTAPAAPVTLPFHGTAPWAAHEAPRPETPKSRPPPAPNPGTFEAPSPRAQHTLDMPLGEALPVMPFRVGRSPLAGTVLGTPLPAAPPPSAAPPSTPVPPPPAIVPPVMWPETPPPPAFPPLPPLPPMVRSEPPPPLMAEPPRPPSPPPPRPTPQAPPAAEAAPPAEPDELPLDEYPLERCAAIAATIAHGKRDRGEILEAEDLSADRWARLHKHWIDHVRAAEGRGQTGPTARYDAAYVARLEEARGEVTTDEYARLLVATERGRADEAMADLDLPKGAFLRVQRVWLRRTAADAELGKAARVAIDAARRS